MRFRDNGGNCNYRRSSLDFVKYFSIVPALIYFILISSVSWSSERVALVIGNNDYLDSRINLFNAVSDATIVAESLEATGFSVEQVNDATRRNMKLRVIDLAKWLNDEGAGATVVLFFAGHAVEFDGTNYLLPSRTDLLELAEPTKRDFEDDAISAQWIVDTLGGTAAARVIIVLDACRDDPFLATVERGLPRRGRGIKTGGGLARMIPPKEGPDTMFLFSAQPRKTALDGPKGGNSHFSKALSEAMILPGLDISEIYHMVSDRVRVETEDFQRPHIEGLVRFVFNSQGSSKTVGIDTFVGSAPIEEAGSSDGKESSAVLVAADRIRSAENGVDIMHEVLKTRSVGELQQASDKGDGFAAYILGLAYWDGEGGLRRDPNMAQELMMQAIAQGVHRAATSLGYFHCCDETGTTPKNEDLANKWFRTGIRNEVAGSYRNLAFSYQNGTAVEVDIAKAEELFIGAAELGLAQAYDNAAWLYRSRQYGQVDYGQAISYHEMALRDGYLEAAVNLSQIFRWGYNSCKDIGIAKKYLQYGADRGCSNCWNEIGNIFSDSEAGIMDERRASQAYLAAAELGDAVAMVNVARRLKKGTGFTQPDPKGSVHWYERAMELGNAEAKGSLGKALAKGEGVPADPERAAVLLEEVLSLQNDPETQYDVYVPNYWGYGQALAELHEKELIATSSSSVAKELRRQYGKGTGMKRFTIPIDCGAPEKSPFHVYIIDWERDQDPVAEQAAWLSSERGCEIEVDVLESFRKLFNIAKENKVAYTDLTVYALGNSKKATGDASSVESSNRQLEEERQSGAVFTANATRVDSRACLIEDSIILNRQVTPVTYTKLVEEEGPVAPVGASPGNSLVDEKLDVNVDDGEIEQSVPITSGRGTSRYHIKLDPIN